MGISITQYQQCKIRWNL